MRLIDRHIAKEFLGPFIFGIGTFVIILLGVQLAPWMLRLLVRDQYPAGIVGLIFLYRLPSALALTLPMATMFGSLMATAAMSGNGEIVAMRAGGVSLLRLAAPILVAGLVISIVSLAFNELLVPACNDAAQRLVVDYSKNARPMEHLTFSIPKDAPQRIVYAQRFDPKRQLLEGLTIMEMRNGRFWQLFSAKQALWAGQQWQLRDVEHRQALPDGSQRTERIALMSYDVGKSPAEFSSTEKDPIDMSFPELLRERQRRMRMGLSKNDILQVVQTMHMRLAVPWAALGFALIGLPLGLRPVRATTSIGLGVSLVIVFAYYVILNAMNLVGQQGTLPVVLTAWFPNLVLFAAGFGLFMSARR